MYLKASTIPPLFSTTPFPDTPHQKERYPQGKGNELLILLATQEAVGALSIHTRERLGVLLKFYSREAA